MTDPKSDYTDPVLGDPEGEWNSVVRRISERIRRKGSAGPTTQSGLDLAGELVRLERRAREAESTLERERGAYALRVQEMEEKLKKVEPWLRQLKSEYQKASAERDRLRDELARGTRSGSPETVAVEPEDRMRVSTLLEAEAARMERDAALAEAEDLRKRIEHQKSGAEAAAELRIAAAEKARDEAAEDLKQMKRSAGDGRRSDEEVKRLLKQVEQLETTTSVHKAVARAAQETADQFAARVGELEKALQEAQTKAAAAAPLEARVRELESARSEKERTDSAAEQLGADAAGARVSADSARVRDLEAELERTKSRAQALASEVSGRAQALDQQAQEAARRFESAETSFRSQMRAAEARFEMDLHRERERARTAEEASRVFEERNARVLVDFDAEVSRLRSNALQFLGAKAQEMLAGMQRILGDEPIVVPPITMSMENPRTPTATVVVPQPAATETPRTSGATGASSPVAGEWDRLMSDVEQLCSEVKDLRDVTGAKPTETDSVSVEVDVAEPDHSPAPEASSDSDESDGSDSATQPDPEAQTIEMAPPFAQQAAEAESARRARKKRR